MTELSGWARTADVQACLRLGLVSVVAGGTGSLVEGSSLADTDVIVTEEQVFFFWHIFFVASTGPLTVVITY